MAALVAEPEALGRDWFCRGAGCEACMSRARAGSARSAREGTNRNLGETSDNLATSRVHQMLARQARSARRRTGLPLCAYTRSGPTSRGGALPGGCSSHLCARICSVGCYLLLRGSSIKLSWLEAVHAPDAPASPSGRAVLINCQSRRWRWAPAAAGQCSNSNRVRA